MPLNFKNIKFEVIKKLSDTGFKYIEIGRISELQTVSTTSVFVGSKLKYPLVNVGILSPLEGDENSWIYDNEKHWAEENFQIGEVVKLRDSLLNSKFRSQVQDARLNKKFVELAKEIAVAAKPVDVEIKLKKAMKIKLKDNVTTPHGIAAPLEKARITGNVSVNNKVDKVINDDIKASDAMTELYKAGFNEYTLNKILTVGVLGLKKNRRLVPTRWSITATDDTIGKQLLQKIRDYKIIEDYGLFFGEFMGNQYIILLFPDIWSYELFELYYPGSSWNPSDVIKASTDNEWFEGRKNYASNTAGGYYASRLPVIEYLNSIKRQASVLAIRLETPSYWAALGVWVVRESVRKAIANGFKKFNSREELLQAAKQITKIKYNFDAEVILKQSKLLTQVKSQKKINEWF